MTHLHRTLCLIILFTSSFGILAQTKHLKGVVLDEKKNPIAFANVYIEGTIDGASTNEDGTYDLETDASGEITLVSSFVGYKTFSTKADISKLNNLTIILKANLTDLNEVVVSASSFILKGNSTLEKKNAVELVTTAGSEGDLYKSIALLPGTQTSGVDGKLQVRGGSSDESQTYIDDMHVMSPYSSMPENTAVRGRFSPFIFDAINFSMGGYSPEYSQSLSSVLPLSTKDESPISKTGLSLMSIGLGTGGTKAWSKASTSFDAHYTNLEPYTKLIYPSEKIYWEKYYQGAGIANQTRFTLGDNTYLKTYMSYNKTLFKRRSDDPFKNTTRTVDFDEDNLYLNSTFRKRFKSGINYFAGAAFSWNRKNIGDAIIIHDTFKSSESELHLKTKADKRFSSIYKLGGGIESLIRKYDMTYHNLDTVNREVNYSISGMYINNDFNLSDKLLLNISSRLEYTSLDNSWAILPRVAVNYNLDKGITLSAIIGRYQQAVNNNYLVYNEKLSSEKSTQYVLSAQNSITQYRFIRAELYYKNYDKLATKNEYAYKSDGKGYSKGIDLMYKDGFSISKKQTLEYMLAYSFNDSKRKYLEYTEKITPSFVTKHNAAVTLKYWNSSLKSIIGITNRFSSGRTYHDPNKEGIMNAETPAYNTLDLSLTLLPSKRLIIYMSASNILNRENIFGYNYNSSPGLNGKYERVPIKATQNQFFFIGFFISLGGKAAYDPSSF